MTHCYIAMGVTVRPEFLHHLPAPMQDALAPALVVAHEMGGEWETREALRGMVVQCVAVDPLRAERVYCGTFDRGVWFSDDTGQTWQPVGAGIRFPAITAIAVSALERRGDYGVVYVGTEPSAIYRSDDGGTTWQEGLNLGTLPSAPEWSFPPRPQTHHVRCIGLDAQVPGRHYLCIENGAFLRSDDDGQTWEDRRPNSPRDTHTLATHAKAPNRLYSAAGDGFQRLGYGYAESTDAGETWERISDGFAHHYLYGLAVDPGNPDSVIVSAARSPEEAHSPLAADSVIYYRSAGTSWQVAHAGLPASKGTVIPILASHPAERGVFYAASNRGLFRSANGGEGWEQMRIAWSAHYQFMHALALVVAP